MVFKRLESDAGMCELIPEDCIVDYLSLCFAINASIAFDKIQNIFRCRFRRARDLKLACLAAVKAELGGKQEVTGRVMERMSKAEQRFDHWMESSRRRGQMYSIAGCVLCFAAIVLSGHSFVKNGHAMNLGYLFPGMLFFLDVSCGWSVWRLDLWRGTRKVDKYRKLKDAVRRLEDDLLPVPQLSPASSESGDRPPSADIEEPEEDDLLG